MEEENIFKSVRKEEKNSLGDALDVAASSAYQFCKRGRVPQQSRLGAYLKMRIPRPGRPCGRSQETPVVSDPGSGLKQQQGNASHHRPETSTGEARSLPKVMVPGPGLPLEDGVCTEARSSVLSM